MNGLICSGVSRPSVTSYLVSVALSSSGMVQTACSIGCLRARRQVSVGRSVKRQRIGGGVDLLEVLLPTYLEYRVGTSLVQQRYTRQQQQESSVYFTRP